MNSNLTSLNSLLEKQYFKYIVYLVLSSIVAAFIAVAVSYSYERFQACSNLTNRIGYLNDVFAREAIIGSPETFKFELTKLKNEFALSDIEYSKDPSKSKHTCSISLTNQTVSHPIKFSEKIIGYIIFNQSSSNLIKFTNIVFIAPLLVIVLLSFSFIMSLKRILRANFFAPVTRMLEEAEASNLSTVEFSYSGEIKEFDTLKNKLNEVLLQIKIVNDQNFQLEKAAGIGELASQVAHDIRSPLEVLKSAQDELGTLSNETRRKLQLSINRMEEISFNLLKAQRETDKFNESKSEELLSVIQSMVIEKKIEYKKKRNIQIEAVTSQRSYGLFSEISRGNLKSIISNLINNSVESMATDEGFISIELYSNDDFNTILISDNGPGILPTFKKDLFSKGKTTKSFGNGLGLYNAKKEIESLNGTINLVERDTTGTVFKITLPKSIAPITFIRSIPLYKYKEVIILDDDVSFHEIWEKKLKDSGKILHKFFSGIDLITKFTSIPSTTLLLSDYEMLDQGMNGIDTILKLNHSQNSVLVTARSEERQIQERCANISLKLLPKNMIPFLVLEEIQPEIVLIDDDKLIHYEWKNYFSNSIKFQSFYSIEDFISNSKSISTSALIYLDSDLGHGIVGEVDGIALFNLGFKNLYLSTGFQKEDINKPNWIIDIFPKNPKKIFGNSNTVN